MLCRLSKRIHLIGVSVLQNIENMMLIARVCAKHFLNTAMS